MLQLHFSPALRQPNLGENLEKMTSDLERESRLAYAATTPGVQEDNARYQFMEALGPGHLQRYLRLQRSLTLQAALRMAWEWEKVAEEEEADKPQVKSLLKKEQQ
ncbi:UNVERIFIED_CONTAM: hypothetical protein FKN15_042523 [Acipenser sinensis]